MDFWIFGGIGSNGQFSDKTHLLRNGTWYDGPQLSQKIKGMCAVNVFDQYAMIIGGENEDGKMIDFIISILQKLFFTLLSLIFFR